MARVYAAAALVLAVAVAGGILHFTDADPVVTFVVTGAALGGVAWLIGIATESVGARFGPAVTGAGKGRAAGALELNVAASSAAVDHLAQEQSPAVAKLGHEAAELVAGIGLRQRRRSLGDLVAGKDARAPLAIERGAIKPQFLG